MEVLVVGAGMLGTMYGAHLAWAGHSVTFLVRRPRPADPVRLEGVRPRRAFTLTSPRYVTRVADAPRPDFALLCVRADPLDLALLDRLAAELPPACVLVSFTPGFGDADAIVARFGTARALFALPSTWVMQEHDAVRFYLPPLSPTRLGPHPREREADSPVRAAAGRLARALSLAGVPTRYDRDTVAVNHAMTAAFAPVAALFLAHPGDLGAALADGPLLRRVCDAIGETAALARTLWGEDHAPDLAVRLVRPATVRALGALVRRLQPDSFRFAERHFTKIHAQNVVMLRDLLARARAHGVETPLLAGLVADYATD